MTKRIAILQSTYIPWKGYFDLINKVDEFILYDDVQFTAGDWRNRNRIKTQQGTQWLTIPVEQKGKLNRSIRDTKVTDRRWARKHWATLRQNYARSPHVADYADRLADIYLNKASALEYLSDINHLFLTQINDIMCIRTPIRWSSEFDLGDDRNERLVQICLATAATRYLSGPAARDYLDEDLFRQYGIGVEWMDYSGYPEYPQLHGGFEHGVSALDLLFNTGSDAQKYMLSFEA